MAWIEVHDNLREHHKTYALANALNLEQFAAVGLVVSLWTWAINHAQDGDLGKYPAVAIASACHWKKKPQTLLDALYSSGFITADFKIHDWDVYAGKLIDRREANAKRNREARAKKDAKDKDPEHHERITSVSCDGATVPNLTVPNLTIPNHTNRDIRTQAQKHQNGPYRNVLLSDEDLDALKAEHPRDWQKRIDTLSEYMASSGKAYKNHLATLRAWARRDREGTGSRGSMKKVGFQDYEDAVGDLPASWAGVDLMAEAASVKQEVRP